jgi:clan AA aspartic protease
MGLTYTTATIRAIGPRNGTYEGQFLVDTGATDTLVPAAELRKIGMKAVGKMAYELADGTIRELDFGLAQIEFMGEVTAGRVVFGPEGSEPLLGATAVESVGIVLDSANKTLRRLPAIPLK